MPPAKKLLYVRTLIGHERSKEAKGGNERGFEAPPEVYVKRIGAAYARGSQKSADAVFEELGERR